MKMLRQPGVEVQLPEECIRYFRLMGYDAQAEGIEVPGISCIPRSPGLRTHLQVWSLESLKKGGTCLPVLVGPLAQAWPSPASFGDDPAVPSNLEPSKFATCPGWAAGPKWKWNSQVPGSLLHHQLRHQHQQRLWICQSTVDDCQPVFFSVFVFLIHHHQPQTINQPSIQPGIRTSHTTHPSTPSHPSHPPSLPISSFILYRIAVCCRVLRCVVLHHSHTTRAHALHTADAPSLASHALRGPAVRQS